MRYWLTTHWPPLKEEHHGSPHSGVWLAEGKLHAASGMAKGDLIAFYQLGSGPAEIVKHADGSISRIARHEGRMGIVSFGELMSAPIEQKQFPPESYEDGREIWWKYLAWSERLTSNGFVPREVVVRTLGYEPGYFFRGFGVDRSGLKEISAEAFGVLKAAFLEAGVETDNRIAAEIARHAARGGGIGEGAIHKALKERIASDPAGTLSEPGLSHWKTEYVLPTGDRVDIILTDENGRFVVVEIEPDCCADEIIGPMQCVKYRALLSFLYGHPLDEVRAILVSPRIHDDVRRRCATGEIECRCVPV